MYKFFSYIIIRETLSEKQGVGSWILPLITINIGSNSFHNCTNQNSAHFIAYFVEHIEKIEYLEQLEFLI